MVKDDWYYRQLDREFEAKEARREEAKRKLALHAGGTVLRPCRCDEPHPNRCPIHGASHWHCTCKACVLEYAADAEAEERRKS